MTVDLKFLDRVRVDGFTKETIRICVVVAGVFADFGFLCYATSGTRHLDLDSLHGYGKAVDFDTDHDLHEDVWKALEGEVQRRLDPDYYALAHDVGKGWHLHVEHDPSNRGVAGYLEEENGED